MADAHFSRSHVEKSSSAPLPCAQWVTVDNIAAEEDGGLSFVSGEPFSVCYDIKTQEEQP